MIELSKRETRLIQILGVVVGILLVYFLIITPIMNLRDSINKEYEQNMSNLTMLDKLYEQYQELKQKNSQYSSQLNNTRGITSLIEENAQSLNIIKNKTYTRDRPTVAQGKYKKVSADVRFEGLDINSILNFIYKMENSGMLIQISYLRINQTIKGRNTYDATMTFNSITSQ
ncbi:MAG TPA: type II secretion system protein GspM [Spirochaetota bacterium]|nr:type II secretion system protein M [Spirochaetota bacterium]HOD14194.1 type II secretion system protein GspM [Spirochaetota bacterium]HPG50885.1 type II secretion system protein GspM [Spirochaetota bacterium]HPN13107.1 type II secretion system protein GspM [Spirochaetota bacterium]HQL82263.1 type II secretion system protein GspM [Spirochaetota bacterium]